MSLLQVEDLVSHQLRTSYLSEVADGVGERLITINDSFLNTGPFKAAGWRSNPAHIKRTHSPPIPTAVASEYFQAAPRLAGLTLEDEADEGGMLTGGGGDTLGPTNAAKRRRERRREQMEEEDSSDLSDESDEESDQRAAQQIRFAKMPVRNRAGSSPPARSRAGSSPLQPSNLRQTTNVSSPRAAPGARRGSQSALETVKERARRDTVTSSEVSSENEFDASGFHRQRDAARAAAKAARIQAKINEEPTEGVKRQGSELLPEEEEDSDESDTSSAFVGSVDSTGILGTGDTPIVGASPGQQVVGTVPKQLLRQSTVRKPPTAPQPQLLQALPPPRPMSTIRPLSVVQPRSLLSDAFKTKKTAPSMSVERFASLSGKGDPDPLKIRIFAPFSQEPEEPFEVLIRRSVQESDGTFRPVLIAELIGLSLWTYYESKLQPPIPADKMSANWWTLRMVEEDGEVDDDFPPFERKKPVNAFTTANNMTGRSRRGGKTHDNFGLVQASESEFADNQEQTPEFGPEDAAEETPVTADDLTPVAGQPAQMNIPPPSQPRANPITNTSVRIDTLFADKPAAPAAMPVARGGHHKLLRINIISADIAPGQMVTLDVTTDMYLAEILELVCRKRNLDKSQHVFKLPGSGAVVYLDRTVSSIGNVSELELHRRRFATDGPLTMTGSPSSSSPKSFAWTDYSAPAKKSKAKVMTPHPLAQEAMLKQDEAGVNVNYKKYTVWRKQPMRFVGLNERTLAIDGEYVYIMPSSGGKTTREGGKTTTVHFSNVVGCSVSRRHPTHFKLMVYKATETKRYDFEARNTVEAAEIVQELKKGVAPYNRDI
ncbi:stress-activated map kinase interacting protein 1-domain-containing protein [Microdochium trichocladiopsis]|uniref:Stress-activated map kinase interacting protein 1-domain-containing protein n=1 Tax=Microdochium trichocladiopsis TaxID=1682393 RepID=A0A9P8YCE6_9PEZI|nr:stress-activated map kinase interacting protein 1-domain-containing protein [Microdochium trichocladiopsis]KAH7038176.1 stress-activated map kinase interacting protein 1-domain-containing protein [Microdochium trichocladiopsis]